MDYGIKSDHYEIISGSAYLFRSGALSNPTTAISASTAQIVAITCSSNWNNRLTKLTTMNAYGIITVTSGSSNNHKDTRIILRYISGSSYGSKSKTSQNLIYSSSNDTVDHLLGGIETNLTYVDIPLLNNDDEFAVAYKTVNALNNSVGYNVFWSASLVDDGSQMLHYSSSIGNMIISESFKVRSGSTTGTTIGKFLIRSIDSGALILPDFDGTKVQIGGMMISSSFKVGGSDPVFTYNIVQSGSGALNQAFYEGNKIIASRSLAIQLDPADKLSGMISGSNLSASLYFSGSGQMGFGTTNPQTDFDIAVDKFQVRSRRESKGVFINSDGDIESYNKSTAGAATGSEFIMKYSRGGSDGITALLIAQALYSGNTTNANSAISAAGGLAAYIANLDPNELHEVLLVGEENGTLSTKASAGDILGSIRWVMDSGSVNEELIDSRAAGEALKIQGKVATSQDDGVTGDMVFYVAKTATTSPVEVLRLAADGNVYITGSIKVSGSMDTMGPSGDDYGTIDGGSF
tara:strand:- start:3071 stop:4630 length:1560 start_codon:yes stop_codon:yes gene_type:complete